jgi:hypothetical protein
MQRRQMFLHRLGQSLVDFFDLSPEQSHLIHVLAQRQPVDWLQLSCQGFLQLGELFA